MLSSYQINQLYLGDKQFSPVEKNTLPNLATNSTVIAQDHTSSLPENLSMVDAIQKLLNSTSLTGINDTNSTGINDTSSLPVVPTITNLKSSYMMSESPEFEFKMFKDSDIKKIKKTATQSMQQDKWSEKNTVISIKVIAPDGIEIPIKSQFKKMKEGQFDIKLVSGRYGKPGMYTIKTTLVKNGKTYDTQSQYAWGLVSLNTEKSIYQPGQTANMTIVVLDSGGHPVCDANILLNVKDPNSQITSLSSVNGVVSGSECGLYNAQYVTSIPGSYTVNATAIADSIKTDFSTSFLVQNNFAFDIVRTAQSKIDPVNNPNSFNVKMDITSFVNQHSVTIKELVPSVLDIKTDANVQTVGNTKVLTWNKNLIGNKTLIQYSYSVPLVFPQLYSLGPVEIDYGNSTFYEARPWYVAVDPIPKGNSIISTTGSSVSTLNFTLTTPSLATAGSQLLLTVGVSISNQNTALTKVKNVLWGTGVSGTNCKGSSTALVNSTSTAIQGTTGRSEIYYLGNGNIANSVTQNVCVIFTGTAQSTVVGAVIFNATDQSANPIDFTHTITGSSATIKNTINTAIGDMVFDTIVVGNNANPTMSITGGNQTILWNTGTALTSKMVGAASSINSTGTHNTMAWTLSATKAWASSAISIKRAVITTSISDSLTFTDTMTKTTGKSIQDSLTFNDQATPSKAYQRSIPDSLTFTD
ncbi:MG2 domain-containing protein, partial [Candidatus Nitrosotalea sp. FS]|uniref:MG2 domain-containing protein n=1 Tax=Candidatus Nitrosotalea sp. FS TaxID=2341021 RepID=UPI00140BE29F